MTSPITQPVDNPLPPIVVSPYARNYARRHATAHMYYTIAIDRMAEGVFDPGTGGIIPAVKIRIYEGPARIWSATGPQVLPLGEDQMAFVNTNISIPWNTDPVPMRDDIAVVLTYDSRHQDFGDAALVDRTFRILSVEFGGQMYAVRRMTAVAIQASAAWGPDALQ